MGRKTGLEAGRAGPRSLFSVIVVGPCHRAVTAAATVSLWLLGRPRVAWVHCFLPGRFFFVLQRHRQQISYFNWRSHWHHSNSSSQSLQRTLTLQRSFSGLLDFLQTSKPDSGANHWFEARQIDLAPFSRDAIGVAFCSETDCTQDAFWKSVSTCHG